MNCKGSSNQLPKLSQCELAILLFGVLLRIYYAAMVPFNARSYDSDSHVWYINYVLHRWQIPLADADFESYQPPLYYFVSAAVGSVGRLFGLNSQGDLNTIWTWESCLLSCALLVLSVSIARKVFSNIQTQQQIWFIAAVAFFPCAVHYASRITNDSLYFVFSFLWMDAIVDFWQKQELKSFARLSIYGGLGLLCKFTMLPLALASFVILFLSKQLNRHRKLQFSVIGAALLIALTGWFYIPRALETLSVNPDRFVIGNIQSHFSVLWYKPEIKDYFVFNPIEVIVSPRSSPWISDDSRRMYFWEYYFKSAFTGEFLKGESTPEYGAAQLALAVSIIFLPFLFVGLIHVAKNPSSPAFPWMIATFLLIASQAIYTHKVGFANVQDFRYGLCSLLFYAYCIIEYAFSEQKLASFATFALTCYMCLLVLLIIIQATYCRL